MFWQKKKQQKKPRSPIPKRIWDAAKSGLLTAGWVGQQQHIDIDIRSGLRILRARSRQQAQNNDHVRHFLRMTRINVVGHDGIKLQARVRTPAGDQDAEVNDAIESSWHEWARYGAPDVSGAMSWRELQNQFITTVARDGEAIYRKILGWPDNPHRYALQAIDPETIDVDLNKDLGNGNRIVMGIELDGWRRPRNYYLVPEKQVTSTFGGSYSSPQKHEVIPASEIYHCFLPEWVWQTRGVPWTATALLRLNMLGAYEDAEVTAARVSAAKMGFYKPTEDAGEFVGDGEDGGKDDEGNFIHDAKAGEFEILPFGYEFQGWDPQHPNSNFAPFVKEVLRGVASGLGVNYNSLANDLEGVNYTSLRHGALTERDIWMSLQTWMIECFIDRVYRDWMDSSLLVGAIDLPSRQVNASDLHRASWQPRRWPWVDPLKERQAQKMAYDMRVQSLSEIIRESGRDPDEVWAEMQRENALLESMGLAPVKQEQPAEPAQPKEADDDEDDEK